MNQDLHSLFNPVLAGLLLLVLALHSATAAANTWLNRKPGWPGKTITGASCYGGDQGYGPYDYITERPKVPIVESRHFGPGVEQLQHTPKSDRYNIDYTLRAIPNHHRALWAAARQYLRDFGKSDPNIGMTAQRQTGYPPPECYLQRAKVFNSRDGMISAIFGIYLHKRGEYASAMAEYQRAEEMSPMNGEIKYNMGLLYFDMGDVDKAREYAEKAKEHGFPLTGLSRKIRRAEASASTGR